MSLSVVNDGVLVDVTLNEMEGNLGLESGDDNLKTASVKVITKEDHKASQDLVREMKLIENKKLGRSFESNTQEMEGAMSPLPKSIDFDETQSFSTSMMSTTTPDTMGHNRTTGTTIAHLLAQNKAINKIDSNTKVESTQRSKAEARTASTNEQKSTLDPVKKNTAT